MSEFIERDKCARWEALLGQFPSSGLTVREFCRQRGVSEPSFYTWRRRLRGGRDGRGPGRACGVPLFVPLRAAAGSAAAPAAETAAGPPAGTVEPGRIELLLGGGVTVCLSGEVPAARLAAVLGVLGVLDQRGHGGGRPC